jgi:hypothetical protein
MKPSASDNREMSHSAMLGALREQHRSALWMQKIASFPTRSTASNPEAPGPFRALDHRCSGLTATSQLTASISVVIVIQPTRCKLFGLALSGVVGSHESLPQPPRRASRSKSAGEGAAFGPPFFA